MTVPGLQIPGPRTALAEFISHTDILFVLYLFYHCFAIYICVQFLLSSRFSNRVLYAFLMVCLHSSTHFPSSLHLFDFSNTIFCSWLANCTWSRRLKYDWTEGRQEVCRLEEEFDKDAVCHQFDSTCTANALPKKLWKGLKTSTSEGKLFKLWNMQMILC